MQITKKSFISALKSVVVERHRRWTAQMAEHHLNGRRKTNNTAIKGISKSIKNMFLYYLFIVLVFIKIINTIL